MYIHMYIENILNMCSWAKQSENIRLLAQGKIARRSYRKYKEYKNEKEKWNTKMKSTFWQCARWQNRYSLSPSFYGWAGSFTIMGYDSLVIVIIVHRLWGHSRSRSSPCFAPIQLVPGLALDIQEHLRWARHRQRACAVLWLQISASEPRHLRLLATCHLRSSLQQNK